MFYAPIILIPHLHNVYDSSQAPQSHVLTDQVRPDQGGHGEVPHKSAPGDVPRDTGHWSPDGRSSGVVTTEADDWSQGINCLVQQTECRR